jgi:ATP-dependent DNA helicase RecQ
LTGHLPDSKGSAVVYTATRDGAEQAAEYLQLRGWPAAAFHAGLPAPEKRAVQESFIHGDTRVICATNAFGMGIDKEDVRLVLHVDIPGSLENYLQEAGRAGRDLKDAECVLLYDEQDVETQFRMEAASELTRRDIAEILRGLRRARRNETGDVVLTAGELLRAEEVDTSFDFSDRGADTKVKTAVAWLERAGFVERNQNNTRVFQGMPLVKNMEEARARISRLNLSPMVQKRWESVLAALINADADQGMSADELAELPAFRSEEGGGALRESRNREESDTQVVLQTLHDMAEAGLVKKGLLLSAFVRHKVKMHSQLILERVSSLEEKMLGILRELAPDAAEEGWLDLSLRKLNQRVVDEGYPESNPQVILNLLKSLGMDGRGLAGNRGSLDLHQIHQDLYRIKLQRGWDALSATAKKRRMVAQVALETMLSKIPADAPPGADLLVSFSSDDIARAMRRNVYLAGQIKDPLAAIDRGLMFLHEQKAIILQQGLAVFRQAMTIRVLPQARSRKYTAGDYEPLQWHYKERVLQVHVMNEYARLGMEKIRQALEMVLAYFSMDKAAFVKRFFAGRKEIIERATGQESYRRIVDELGNRAQTEIVGAPDTGNMLVLAGPGSGKTKVVVHRCAYLLRVKRAPARSLLVLCYNRSAAVSLKHRLFELVGEDAKGIMVQTYHGLAMRLTGTSFADLAERGGGEAPDFGRLIPDAVSLLRGEKEVPGLEPDELRDRLLAGYRHILVDEYQDIDREQYDLISALAGRTEQDHDRKLTILAVGDDDQNIYTFRGANVEFIRKFRDDYRARVFHLVENYRSTGHIISAANELISHNLDRMKTGHAIRVDKRREVHPPGGRWEALDPIGRGRVQVVEVEDDYHQAVALVEEMLRLRALDPRLRWSDCGVLARTRETLHPIRALCEHHGIPVVWGLSGNKTPALHRIREIGRYLDELKSRRGELLRGSQLKDLLTELAGGAGCMENPWWLRLLDLIESWMDETADEPMPAGHTVEYIHEALSEQRRDQSVGHGVFLGTVHGAKGMEYGHVFIPDGGWGKGRKPLEEEVEEDRRVFYVGMTRARETLCLFQCRDVTNPHVRLLDGDFLVRRQAPLPRTALSSTEGEASPAVPREVSREATPEVTRASTQGVSRPITLGVLREITRYRYELLGLQDMFLDLAARRPPDDPIHRRLGALKPGSVLQGRKAGDRLELLDEEGARVAALSRAASAVWLPRLPLISSIRVVGMIRRNRKDSGQEYSHLHRCDSWEVPWVEVVYHLPKNREVTFR